MHLKLFQEQLIYIRAWIWTNTRKRRRTS